MKVVGQDPVTMKIVSLTDVYIFDASDETLLALAGSNHPLSNISKCCTQLNLTNTSNPTYPGRFLQAAMLSRFRSL